MERTSDNGNDNQIPDGDTTEDLYALLAMSKKRLAASKVDTNQKDSEDELKQSNEINNDETSELPSEATNMTKEAVTNDACESEVNKVHCKEELTNNEDDGRSSDSSGDKVASAVSRDIESDLKSEEETGNSEGGRRERSRHNAETPAKIFSAKTLYGCYSNERRT